MVDLIFNLLGEKSIFSDQAMLWVFFFYGLGFLILAGVVFLKKRKLIDVDLTFSFYFLGLFGLIHGLTEWIDFSRLYLKIHYNLMFVSLDVLKIVFLTISFLLLMQFGINLLTINTKKLKFLKLIPLVLGIIFFSYAVYFKVLGSSELIIRYCFGYTSAILTSIALFKIFNLTEKNKNLKFLRKSTLLMLIAFLTYSIFGGLINFVIFGIPPQFIRMLCALLIAYGSFTFLKILEHKLSSSTN